jgi:hypothetical protein
MMPTAIVCGFVGTFSLGMITTAVMRQYQNHAIQPDVAQAQQAQQALGVE